MTRRGDAAAIGIGCALGAGAALAGLALFARRAARPAGPDDRADPADPADPAANALRVRQAMQARWALQARDIDHDLRTPVGAMAVALELLRTAHDPATRRDVADVLERQIAQMTTLTERVHALAQSLAD